MDVASHRDDGSGRERPVLVWRFDPAVRMIASAVVGGGVGERSWVFNAEVMPHYHREPTAHLAQIACELDLDAATGVGLLTAASVLDVSSNEDAGVTCDATVGVAVPAWAAAPDGALHRWAPGTINLVCFVPAPLHDAALVNAVVTATEAKTQAMVEHAVPGTGTASDAVVICCPPGATEQYCGPRSTWGARLARAVHAAVGQGIERSKARIP